jgi:hypothetical protein
MNNPGYSKFRPFFAASMCNRWLGSAHYLGHEVATRSGGDSNGTAVAIKDG